MGLRQKDEWGRAKHLDGREIFSAQILAYKARPSFHRPKRRWGVYIS